MSFFQMRPLVWASLCVSLAACGGGGGGSSQGTTASQVPVAPSSFSVSGIIQIPAGTLVDLDTADQSSGTLSNNSIADAQFILNPSVVAGYVSARAGYYAGSGSWGYPQDPLDYFSVRLLKGQSVRLEIQDADGEASLNREANVDGVTPKIEFSLIREDGDHPGVVETHQLDATTDSVSLNIADDGDYYILIREDQGPTRYILSVGQASAQTASLSIADDFVPGEVIVAWEQAPVMQNSRSAASALTPVMGSPETGQLMRLNLPVVSQSARSTASVDPAELLAGQKQATLDAIEELRKQPGVRFAEPNYIRRSMAVPSDPYYSRQQWHYSMINLPMAWDAATGADTVVAVLDSGVIMSHPDLQGQFVAGYDFISRSDIALDGDGLDPDPTDPGSSLTGGSNFHGTHVAGTVAAIADNGVGVVGVAHGARIMPLRVLGKDGKGSDADIAEAVRYAAGLPNASGLIPSRSADVINMSLGSSAVGVSLQNAIKEARAQGVIIVASAGNDGSHALNYPAAFPEVVSVSAVTRDKVKAGYSNFGATINVAAPGGGAVSTGSSGIYSTWATDTGGKPALPGYAYMEGTSMAAPHVAGVVALMKAARQVAGKDPLTPAMFDQFLANGYLTQDMGSSDYYGAGLIDAAKAVSTAVSDSPDPLLVAYPGRLLFDGAINELVLTVENGGSGDLPLDPASAVSVTAGSDWLAIDPVPSDIGVNGPWFYRVRVDRAGLRSGVQYSGRIQVQSGFNTVEVPVLLQMPDSRRSANAGRHYVMLIDPDKPEEQSVVQQVAVDADNGSYRFQFSDVEPGRYYLLAGSDLDNDGLICDAGEACTAYPVLSAPAAIDVKSHNVSGLSFSTGFIGQVMAESAKGISPQQPAVSGPQPRRAQ